jgi:hypothetical protein
MGKRRRFFYSVLNGSMLGEFAVSLASKLRPGNLENLALIDY